jgi:ParB family chromosome partitioning protein
MTKKVGPPVLKMLKIDKVFENPFHLRGVDRTNEAYQHLAASIKERGVLSPIIVRTTERGYQIIKGLHRYHAARDAGLTEVPAQVIDVTDAQVEEIQIVASVPYVKTKPVEYANQLLRIMQRNPEMTVPAWAKRLDRCPKWIRDTLRLNKLNSRAARLTNDGRIGTMNAYQLSRLTHEDQELFIDKALAMEASEFSSHVLAKLREERNARKKPKD